MNDQHGLDVDAAAPSPYILGADGQPIGVASATVEDGQTVVTATVFRGPANLVAVAEHLARTLPLLPIAPTDHADLQIRFVVRPGERR